MEKYDKSICGLLVDSLSAWNSRWTLTAVACMQWTARVALCFVGGSQRTSHFQLHCSNLALTVHWLRVGFLGFLRQEIGLQGGTHCLRWRSGMWQIGCICPGSPADRHPGSLWWCWCCLMSPSSGALDPRKPWAGDRHLTRTPGHCLLGWEDLCVSIRHQPYLQVWLLEHWTMCTSRYSVVLSCIIPSRGRLGNHVPLKQGHVLLS